MPPPRHHSQPLSCTGRLITTGCGLVPCHDCCDEICALLSSRVGNAAEIGGSQANRNPSTTAKDAFGLICMNTKGAAILQRMTSQSYSSTFDRQALNVLASVKLGCLKNPHCRQLFRC